jgi:hypothetical protein
MNSCDLNEIFVCSFEVDGENVVFDACLLHLGSIRLLSSFAHISLQQSYLLTIELPR